MSIPSLAIHLDRKSAENFTFSTEDHLRPISASAIDDKLNGKDPKKPEPNDTSAHHSILLKLVADELGIEPGNIIDFDLNVIDFQPAVNDLFQLRLNVFAMKSI